MVTSGFKQRMLKKRFNIKKDAAATSALKKLRAFLDAKETSLAYFLVNTWRHQGKAITYKELREAILAGEISADYLDQWRQDYSRFVINNLDPAWREAIDAASKELMIKYPEFNFDPMADGVLGWTETRAADFVTSCTNTQIEALRALVRSAATLNTMGVDQLARAIRPMVGLYHGQAIANLNYFNTLIENGVSTTKALDLSARYGAKQHRYRAMMISRTELAFAYNQGSYEGIKQAQAAGYMGEVVKVWCTADDERTCEECGGLEGKVIAMDEDFEFKTKLAVPRNPTIRRVPPAHPNCRCAVIYKEIAPPIYGTRSSI